MGFKLEFSSGLFFRAPQTFCPASKDGRYACRVHPNHTTLKIHFRLQQDRLLSDLTRSQQFMGSGVSSPGSFMPDPRIFQYRPPGPPK